MSLFAEMRGYLVPAFPALLYCDKPYDLEPVRGAAENVVLLRPSCAPPPQVIGPLLESSGQHPIVPGVQHTLSLSGRRAHRSAFTRTRRLPAK